MRWLVELPAPSGGTAAAVTVDADSWAGALTSARGGSIKKFKCEFEADGVVRVIDLENRDRYTIRPLRATESVRPAPAAEPPAAKPEPAKPEPAAVAEAPKVEAPAVAAEPAKVDAPAVAEPAKVEGPAPAVAEPAKVEGPAVEEAPKVEAPKVEAAAPAEAPAAAVEAPAVEAAPVEAAPVESASRDSMPIQGVESHEPLPASKVLFERDQEPNATNPLSYRERVFAVPAGTTVQQAEQVARQTLAGLRRGLATRPRGRYVMVAVFDHEFSGRAEAPPLVVLRWKDWRGEPEIQVRPALAPRPVSTPPPAASSVVNGVVHTTVAPSSPPVAAAEPSIVVDAPAAPEAPLAAPSLPEAARAPELAGRDEVTVADTSAADAAAEARETSTEPAADPLKSSSPGEERGGKKSKKDKKRNRSRTPSREMPTANIVTAAVTAKAPEVTPQVEASSPETARPETASAEAPAVETKAETKAETPAVEAKVETPAAEAKVEAPAVEAQPAEAPKVAAKVEAPAASAKPVPVSNKNYRRGKDLLSELFDSLMDLAFVADPGEAAGYVAKIVHEQIAATAVSVSLYDIDKDEFVASGVAGDLSQGGQRHSAKSGGRGQAVRKRNALVTAVTESGEALTEQSRGGPSLFAPAMHQGRLFACIQLDRRSIHAGFETDEQDAVMYVAGQLAEHLAQQSRRLAVKAFADDNDARRR
ncbi:MAG: hypothetical protein JNK72_01580 [Myxococcales bacterium]|nr:hypothetical protein [Myxococcales bacterium]